MRRLTAVVLLLAAVTTAAPVCAGADAPAEPQLRGWHFGVSAVSSWRSRYDVFATPDTPAGAVAETGRGAGFSVGHRFGGRFLLAAQMAFAEHDLADVPETIVDVDLLVTGTVLFRERDTLQPFLRGGIGGGGEYLDLPDNQGHLFSFGTAAIAGGGLQVRLSSRVSLELEGLATFTNFLEVQAMGDDGTAAADNLQVRVSNHGWRAGAGVMFWF